MSESSARKIVDAKHKSQPEPRADRKPSEIDVPNLTQEELRGLSDRELRHCIFGAEQRAKWPDPIGRKGRKDLRKLNNEHKRRSKGGWSPVYRTNPPPPPDSSK
jgi:hypothetical protein